VSSAVTDPTAAPARPKNPVTYAEGTLGVHSVYDEAKTTLAALETALTDAARHAAERRSLAEQVADREVVLASDERAAQPDMSQTAFDRHIKAVLRRDPTLASLRHDLQGAQAQEDMANAKAKALDATVRALSARMNELGGLLAFYAARIPPPNTATSPATPAPPA
jgi:hypothetical protein